jgi:type IV secretory pathway VirJ component
MAVRHELRYRRTLRYVWSIRVIVTKSSTRSAGARRVRRGLWVTGIVSAIVVLFVYLAGYFDRDPVHVYPAIGAHTAAPPLVVVNFSGDMGLRFLLGASTSRGLTEHGIPVVGITTPALFARHRTRGDLDAIVAEGVRTALARTGAKRAVVMGQSYGADIVQTGMADLPASLRPRVAAIVLILPGDTVFYRADPSGLLYDHGTPDSIGVTTGNRLDWTPVTCIYGLEETDSLCPLLKQKTVRKVGMPGGHNIHHDADGLLAHVLTAIRAVAPDAGGITAASVSTK